MSNFWFCIETGVSILGTRVELLFSLFDWKIYHSSSPERGTRVIYFGPFNLFITDEDKFADWAIKLYSINNEKQDEQEV